jgi:hypothetical protein
MIQAMLLLMINLVLTVSLITHFIHRINNLKNSGLQNLTALGSNKDRLKLQDDF